MRAVFMVRLQAGRINVPLGIDEQPALVDGPGTGWAMVCKPVKNGVVIVVNTAVHHINDIILHSGCYALHTSVTKSEAQTYAQDILRDPSLADAIQAARSEVEIKRLLTSFLKVDYDQVEKTSVGLTVGAPSDTIETKKTKG